MAEAVRALAGLQAQDRRAAVLALRRRAPGTTAADVEAALADGSVVRTWSMRGTLHLVAADDLPLMLAVFGPFLLRRFERRLAELGLPPDEAARSTEEARRVLAESAPLTRHELAARLRERGVPVAAEGQAPIAAVRRAALAGVLRETGVRGREELYGPLETGPLPDRDAALAELARRYAAAHYPATADDFAAWSGLSAADVRAGWAAAEPGGAADAPPGGVRLLPAFDEWLLGWAERDWTLPPEHAPAVLRGGIVRPVVLVDGCVAGTWRLDRPRRRIEVGALAPVPHEGLAEEAADLGRFLGIDLEVA